MTQRSQFNERYTEEAKPKGVTRKGATAAKPKAAAAASVYIPKTEKTKQQKKAERKERERKEREKQERINKFMPEESKKKLTSPKIKQYRTYWWILLVAAIALTALSWFGRELMPEWMAFVVLILAYASIAGALYLDLGKIRRERNRLMDEMASMNTKAGKAERRAYKAERREAARKAEAEMKAEKAAEANKEKGGLFSRSKKAATDAADSVVEKQQAAKKNNK